jgi:hypothetical protein
VLSATALHRHQLRLEPHDAPIARPASEFVDFGELGGIVYSRTALVFRTIANVYGPERLERALRRYALRYRFDHPVPDALLATLEEELGAAAAANLRTCLFEGGTINYSVRDLRSVRRTDPAPADGEASREPFESRVVIHRHGELRVPVQVLLVAANGERIVEHWDGIGRDGVFVHVGSSPVVSVQVDPDEAIAIDENLLDNARRVAPPAPIATWERVLYAWQLLIGWLGT